MSAATQIDFSKYETASAPQIDFSKYESPAQPPEQAGALDTALGDAKSMASALLTANPATQAINRAIDEYKTIRQTGTSIEGNEDAARKQAGYSLPYRLIAPAAEGVGVNVPAMEQDAQQGNMAGVAGHTVVPTAMALSPVMAEGVLKFNNKIAESIPSKARAQETFQDVMSRAKNQPVNLSNSQDAILKMVDWQKKTQLGPTINKFLNRVTNPKLGPLTYEEGRDFYQLLGRLSADENSRMAPAVRADLVKMQQGLKTDIGNAASNVGKGAEYYDAMSEFKNASSLDEAYQILKKHAGLGLLRILQGTALGAGSAAGYSLYKDFNK